MFVVLIILIVSVVVVTIILFSEAARKKRQEELSNFAAKHSLEFQPTATPESLGIYAPFPLLNRGRSRTVTNAILADTQDTTARLFDYKFTTGSGKNTTTHQFSVVYFKSDLLMLPEFSLTQEKFYHWIGKVFGMQDVNFDTHPKFSSLFLLHGAEETEIRKFFTNHRLTTLENFGHLCIEANQSRCLIYRVPQISSKDYPGWLEESFKVFSVLCEKVDS